MVVLQIPRDHLLFRLATAWANFFSLTLVAQDNSLLSVHRYKLRAKTQKANKQVFLTNCFVKAEWITENALWLSTCVFFNLWISCFKMMSHQHTVLTGEIIVQSQCDEGKNNNSMNMLIIKKRRRTFESSPWCRRWAYLISHHLYHSPPRQVALYSSMLHKWKLRTGRLGSFLKACH